MWLPATPANQMDWVQRPLAVGVGLHGLAPTPGIPVGCLLFRIAGTDGHNNTVGPKIHSCGGAGFDRTSCCSCFGSLLFPVLANGHNGAVRFLFIRNTDGHTGTVGSYCCLDVSDGHNGTVRILLSASCVVATIALPLL
jgi:hypothetical protein